MSSAIVIGAGVGGLAAAIRLAHAGHDVTVVERSAVIGGKLANRTVDGFTWETGPSLLTLPQVFDDLFALGGTSLAAEVDLVRLDPATRHHFADGSTFDARSDPAATREEVERLSPGSGDDWERWHRRAAAVWSTAERTFFSGPIEDPRELVGRMRSPADLLAIDPLPSLHGRATETFHDPRLVQWACRYATYAGSDPWRVPATLGCIPHIEQAYGCWAIRGGLGRLAEALGRLAVRLGVDVRTDAEVTAITTVDGRASGVRLADGQVVAAPTVVADVDAAHLYADLLPDRASLRRVGRAGRSTSGFVLLLAVAGSTERLAHHNVFFSHDYAAEFADLTRGRPPADPTVYVCNATVTDPASAPPGHESWFVLVNVPATDDAADWSPERTAAYADLVLAALDRRGLDVRRRIVRREAITPRDIASRYRAPGGAIYGTSSNGPRAAFSRPGNRGPVPGLYLAGGSSHPGGGLPIVALSGRIVADMVTADLAR
jgi:phytoene desaturase